MAVEGAAVTCAEVLGSVFLAEKDSSGDVMLTWSYPTSDPDTDRHVLMRSEAEMVRPDASQGAWTRYEGAWFYMVTLPAPGLAKVSAVTVTVQASEFHPEKFLGISAALAKTYLAGGTPVRILEGYLSVFTVGKFEGFSEKGFQAPQQALLDSPVAALLSSFGEHAVVLWAAVLMKKRVLVFSEDRAILQATLRAIPALVWHRHDWDVLRPYCLDDEQEWHELAESRVYIAGVTESVAGRDSYWDVFVNVPAQTVEVNGLAKQDFVMTTVHKEMAGVMARAVEEGLSDADCITAMEENMAGLRSKLDVLAANEESGRLSLSALQEQLPSGALAAFLFAVALAEGLADAE